VAYCLFLPFLVYGRGSSDNRQAMMDATKKPLFFKSKVEIFNLLAGYGWGWVDSYQETIDRKLLFLHIFRWKQG